MKDRVTAGFISGLVAGVAMNIIDWIGFLANFYQERLLDWAAVVSYGHLPLTLAETVLAQMGQLFFTGVLGVIFSSLLLKWTSGHYLIKGWIYSIFAWFFLYSISIALRLPSLSSHTFSATLAHTISASVYGLTLSSTLNWLDKANSTVR